MHLCIARPSHAVVPHVLDDGLRAFVTSYVYRMGATVEQGRRWTGLEMWASAHAMLARETRCELGRLDVDDDANELLSIVA